MAVVMICGGILARLVNIDVPAAFTFDEHHFVENARNYAQQRPDWNDHPPLGKLLIAIGMLGFGDGALGWRIVPLVFGILTIGAAYVLGRTAFRSGLAGALAAGFVSIDGFLIAYSKSALLDGMLVFWLLCSAILILRARHAPGFLALGLTIGLAASTKFSGVVMLAPVALVFLKRMPVRRTLALLLLTGVSATAVYFLQYGIGLALSGEAWVPSEVASKTIELYEHHARLTDWKNPLTSRWYTWFVPLEPIMMYRTAYLVDSQRIMTSLGNPLLWWASVPGVLVCALVGLSRVWKRRAAPEINGYLLITCCWLAPLVPWWLSDRDSYIYHYLPTYAFGLVALAGAFSLCLRRRYSMLVAAIAVILVVSGFYFPVWTKLPITVEATSYRLWLSAWR